MLCYKTNGKCHSCTLLSYGCTSLLNHACMQHACSMHASCMKRFLHACKHACTLNCMHVDTHCMHADTHCIHADTHCMHADTHFMHADTHFMHADTHWCHACRSPLQACRGSLINTSNFTGNLVACSQLFTVMQRFNVEIMKKITWI